jgi:hypothetical protein
MEPVHSPRSRILHIGNPRFATITAKRSGPSGNAPRGQDHRCSSLGGQVRGQPAPAPPCGPGALRPYKTTTAIHDINNCVEMIRHDNKFVNFQMTAYIRYFAPKSRDHISNFIQPHFPVNNFAEYRQSPVCNDRYEICACPRGACCHRVCLLMAT